MPIPPDESTTRCRALAGPRSAIGRSVAGNATGACAGTARLDRHQFAAGTAVHPAGVTEVPQRIASGLPSRDSHHDLHPLGRREQPFGQTRQRCAQQAAIGADDREPVTVETKAQVAICGGIDDPPAFGGAGRHRVHGKPLPVHQQFAGARHHHSPMPPIAAAPMVTCPF